jgi:hypothetical protein
MKLALSLSLSLSPKDEILKIRKIKAKKHPKE